MHLSPGMQRLLTDVGFKVFDLITIHSKTDNAEIQRLEARQQQLEQLLAYGGGRLNTPVSSPRQDTSRAISSSSPLPAARKATPAPTPGASDLDTLKYQLDHLRDPLRQIELHLAEGCQIKPGVGCDCCLPPGTLIYGNPAPAPIEKSPVRVVSHSGHIREVTQTFVREYEGSLREIRCRYTNFPLSLTPEHPVLVARAAKGKWRKAGGIDESSLSWVAAMDLTIQDYMVFPRLSETEDREAMTLELCELLGWYVAEGTLGEGRITLSLGTHEETRIARILWLLGYLGNKAHVYRRAYGLTHICFSSPHSEPLFAQFGQGAREKKLPLWVLRLPQEKQHALLRGMFGGDGHQAKYSLTYTTTSQALACQLRLLLFRLGLLHSLTTRAIGDSYIGARVIKPNGPRYDLTIAGDSARALSRVLGWQYSGGQRTAGNFGCVGENYVFLPIRANREVFYRGPVYNIAVDRQESYLTLHGAVHNCNKHLRDLRTLAQETIPIAARQGKDPGIFAEMVDWARSLEPVTTVEASSSGEYRDLYLKESGTASRFRKAVEALTAECQPCQAAATARQAELRAKVADLAHRVQAGEISIDQAKAEAKALVQKEV